MNKPPRIVQGSIIPRVEVDQQPTQLERELVWKKKRSTRITSSCISKLNAGGRGAANVFGKTAMSYISMIVTQIKEGDLMEETDRGTIWQMQFGTDNEPLAINWMRENFMEEVKSGTTDFGDILFMCPNEYFGDSPDGLVYNNDELLGWAEIKCPANKMKACTLTDGTQKLEDVIDEYKDQFIGHFIGNPECDFGYYVIYNAHVNALTGEPYDRGVRFVLDRKDYATEIEATEAKIERVYAFIKLCVAGLQKVENINAWWAVEAT